MKKIYVIVFALLFLKNSHAQTNNTTITDTTKNVVALDEIVVSSNNFVEKKKNIAQSIDVISANTIAQANAQNTGDLLINTGKIFVQKSQQGGSSPVLRGFEASRILLVIDGVRMNNIIFRPGHLQNSITADQNSLSRVEVMYGPSSTIYGSDALGGIVHLITKSPVLSGDKNFLTTGTAFARYSSVNNEKTIHVDASMGGKKIAWFQSYNFSDFGDMKMGSKYSSAYPDFGRRATYIDHVNGIDSIRVNSDDRVQKFSGFKQWDIIQKILFKQNDRIKHSLNVQLSNTNNVPRYDRLQDVKNFGGTIGTALRYADWFYGPQKRVLAAYEFNAVNTGFFSEIKANINYQDIVESRHTREYRRYDRFDSRIEKVKILGGTISGRKLIGTSNELAIGMDFQSNDLQSTATRKNLTTGIETKLDTRYPDGKNRMNNIGIYAQHVYKYKNKKLVLNDGLRLQSTSLKSNVEDNSFFKLPDTTVKQQTTALTGNIGIVYSPNNSTTIRTAISSGFRAPNVDDLAKIFESSTASATIRQVVVPNANIKPEFTYNIDLSISQKIADKVTIDVTGFYTMFRNAIVKAPFNLNGQDSILYNGVKSQVVASQNVNRASLTGVSIGLQAKIIKGLMLHTTLNYTYGRFKTDVTKKSTIYEKQADGTFALVSKNVRSKPLDHIPPLIGKTSLAYEHKKFTTEMSVLYNGWKRLDQFNADGEDNAPYATVDGFPAWATLNWKGSVHLHKHVQLQLAIDNIFDKNYRYFASGFSAGGRNYLVALRANW